MNWLSIPGLFESCDLDDATIFTSDGKFTVANNTKCDADDDDTLDSGTWTLNSDKTSLTVTSTVDGPLFTITKLEANDTNIKGELNADFGLDEPILAKVVMKKK